MYFCSYFSCLYLYFCTINLTHPRLSSCNSRPVFLRQSFCIQRDSMKQWYSIMSSAAKQMMGSLYSTINPVSLLTDTETNTFSNTETNTFTKTRTNTRTNIHFLSWLKFDLIGLDKTKIGQYYKYREQKMLMKHNPGKKLFPPETMTNGVCYCAWVQLKLSPW